MNKYRALHLIKKVFGTTLIIFAILFMAIFLFMKQSKFGKNPVGVHLELIKKSPNYRDGQFQNLNHTPSLAENHSLWGIIYTKLFKKFPRLKPMDTIPSIKTNLLDIKKEENVLVWFGHSSYFIQMEGIRILVDPVLSANASPIPNTVKPFAGSNNYTVADIPTVDYLLITHDHYDHVDYETLLQLKPKIKNVICGLGVGSHFREWGYSQDIIIEKDWFESVTVNPDFTVFIEPARHFSGRGFVRNKTLWASYVLKSSSRTIYVGGDSGYDTHYAQIGSKHGPFDIAILENGQYDVAWPYIHHTPEEVLKAGQDLKASRIFPVHSSKFALANHPWDEPLIQLTEFNKFYNIPLITPMIGEVVNLDDSNQKFEQWWLGINDIERSGDNSDFFTTFLFHVMIFVKRPELECFTKLPLWRFSPPSTLKIHKLFGHFFSVVAICN